MKMSLLDMTQSILSALDSDPVDSIDETVESIQVADFIKETFFELISQRDWPFLRTLTTLTGLGDTNNPTKMLIPETVNKVYWVKYNKKDVVYMEPLSFNDMISQRVAQAGVVDANGFVLNRDPEYWTSYDDQYIVFDGRDSTADTTLMGSKSSIYCSAEATWQHVDSFVPAIPERFFPTLLAEAKSTCFINLKQTPNPKEERKAQRGRFMLRNEVWKNEMAEDKYNRKVNYGRK